MQQRHAAASAGQLQDCKAAVLKCVHVLATIEVLQQGSREDGCEPWCGGMKAKNFLEKSALAQHVCSRSMHGLQTSETFSYDQCNTFARHTRAHTPHCNTWPAVRTPLAQQHSTCREQPHTTAAATGLNLRCHEQAAGSQLLVPHEAKHNRRSLPAALRGAHEVVSLRASFLVSEVQVLRLSRSRAPLNCLNSLPFTTAFSVGYPRTCTCERRSVTSMRRCGGSTRCSMKVWCWAVAYMYV